MKVIKFGGSSLASAEQLKKVLHIVKADSNRKIVVVSAPGKAFPEQTKVTDLLIHYAKCYLHGEDFLPVQQEIIERYRSIGTALAISEQTLHKIEDNICQLASLPKENEENVMDIFKASGEDNHAKLIAAYFRKAGLEASYVNPKEAGLIVSDEPGNAQILASSFSKIRKLRDMSGILVVPGFFGYTETNKICTFSRGGSDVTGSLLAAGVHADLYENFTDVDAIFSAHPGIVANPREVTSLTFREMRELSYSGFTVFHDEALMPAFHAGIEVNIKNTNNPSAPGTMIAKERNSQKQSVVGIAGDSGFSIIYISKYLMNREKGFGRKVLAIIEDCGLSYEHMPSGIDDISVILRENQLSPVLEDILINRLYKELSADEVRVSHDISMIAIVGEGMRNQVGTTAKATTSLAEAGINLEMIIQGSSEVSILFGVNSCDEEKAIRALYRALIE